MPPTVRRRPSVSPVSRKPRVAGRPRVPAAPSTPGAHAADAPHPDEANRPPGPEPAPAAIAVDPDAGSPADATAEGTTAPAPAAGADAEAAPRRARLRRPGRRTARTGTPSRRRPAPPASRRAALACAVAAVLLTATAALAGVSWWTLRHTPAAQNAALVDVGATSMAAQQLGDAVRTVYSYDYARLDENERAAREVVTPAFAGRFDTLFREVRALAPQQKAVVTATVAYSAVQELTADHAVVVMFLDQQATRGDGNAEGRLAAAGRLTVTGEQVDGRWKIADVVAA